MYRYNCTAVRNPTYSFGSAGKTEIYSVPKGPVFTVLVQEQQQKQLAVT